MVTIDILFPKSIGQNKKVAILVFSILFVAIIDMELSNISDIISKKLSSSWGVVTFTFVIIIYNIAQYFLVKYVKDKSADLRTKQNVLQSVNKMVSLAQYLLIFLFVVLILEIFLSAEYYVGMLLTVVEITNLLNIIIMGLLAKWLFSWYKTRKDPVIVLYAISCILFAITAAVSIFFVGNVLSSKPSLVSASTPVFFPSFDPRSVMGIMNYVYYFLGIISYITMWVASVLLLRFYSNRLGKTKYWIICSAPLVFFLGQLIISIANMIVPIAGSKIEDQVAFIFYYSIIFTLGSVIGGILFGLPYWIVAKTMGKHDSNTNANLRNYLNICGFGMALFFASGSATVLQTPYPPFGLVTVSLIGISSYLILVGLYYSAISVSQDIKLRKSIRKFALEEGKLLDNIGSALIEQEINNKVKKFAIEDNSTIDNKITSSALSEEELKIYFIEVLDEIKKEKGSK